MCKIGDVCCLLAPAHQPFSSNSLDLNAAEEAYSRNVRASGTLKFGYKGVFKSLSIYKMAFSILKPKIISIHKLFHAAMGFSTI